MKIRLITFSDMVTGTVGGSVNLMLSYLGFSQASRFAQGLWRDCYPMHLSRVNGKEMAQTGLY